MRALRSVGETRSGKKLLEYQKLTELIEKK